VTDAGSVKPRVGIIGGMGPEATVLLMQRIIAMTAARDDSDHVPLLVDNNTQIPSRIKAIIEKTGVDPDPVLANMARQLEASGAAALAMPCNTAHHYASVIEKTVEIPFLNMIELSAKYVAGMDLPKKRVGVLASPAVRSTALFDRAFSSYQIETIYPVDQARMLDAIRSVKAHGANRDACQVMESAAHELMPCSDILIIACSELSIIADAIPEGFPRLDTVDVLARAVIKFSGCQLR